MRPTSDALKRIIVFIVSGATALAGWFVLSAATAHAATTVGGTLDTDTVWSADGSPYLLTDNVTVPDGVDLTIGPGVTVEPSPDLGITDPSYEPGIDVGGGHVYIHGSSGKRVALNGISGLFSFGGSADVSQVEIADADLTHGAGLSFSDSIATIASTSIIGAETGIWFEDSAVSITGSRIKDGQTGIYIQGGSIFQVRNGGSPDLALIDAPRVRSDAPILAMSPELVGSTSLMIRGSSIAGNEGPAVSNHGSFAVDAVQNWWGSAAGPASTGPNSVTGPVGYAPWLTAEPPFDGAPAASCCSSILFIPGLEGTRLYKDGHSALGGVFGHGTTTDRLWEPDSSADLTKLDLDAHGSSTDVSIYAGGPVDKALGIVDVYGGFMGYLNGLVKKGMVDEWRAFGYDWREPVAGVVAGAEKRATTTESLIRTVADMAAHSRTGKVTIIAHSNGGLVAKDLVKTLADMGSTSLIDSVISVAVPELGTPMAIPALLHGDGQSILGGLIASQAGMRTLGADMPSAYSLLPSRGFFQDILMPTVVFASTTIPGLDNGSYPQAISSAAAQSAFIADTAHVRATAAASDTALPIKGNSLLMAAADALHGILDPFTWPVTIARWAIVGWNDRTTAGVLYSAADKHTAIETQYGDGTVVAPSAAYEGGQVIPIDLSAPAQIDKKSFDHVDILDSSSTQTAIDSIISAPSGSGDPAYSDDPATHNTKVLNELSKIPGVSVGDMDWNKLMAEENAARKEILITTHSPVDLNVYDSQGDHTGVVPLPPEVASQVEPGLYLMSEHGIPDSRFDDLDTDAQGGHDESVSVPDNGDSYTIALSGVGVGAFTLDIERIRATSTIETVEWSGIPVTQMSSATTTFVSSGSFAVAANALASSTAPLSLDADGDGTVDATSSPNAPQTSDRYWDILKKICDSVGRHSPRSIALMKRMDHIRAAMKAMKGVKPVDFHREAASAGGYLAHLRFNRLSDADRDHVLDGIEGLVRQFE